MAYLDQVRLDYLKIVNPFSNAAVGRILQVGTYSIDGDFGFPADLPIVVMRVEVVDKGTPYLGVVALDCPQIGTFIFDGVFNGRPAIDVTELVRLVVESPRPVAASERGSAVSAGEVCSL